MSELANSAKPAISPRSSIKEEANRYGELAGTRVFRSTTESFSHRTAVKEKSHVHARPTICDLELMKSPSLLGLPGRAPRSLMSPFLHRKACWIGPTAE